MELCCGEVKHNKPQKRKRVEMEKIDNKAALEVSFSKRRKGLFNKASELSVLCGAEIAIIVFSPHGNPFVFGHPSADVIIDRYLGRHVTTPPTLVFSTVNMNTNKFESHQSELESMKRVGEDSGFWWERPIEGLGLEELRCYIKEMEKLKEKVSDRLEKMNGEADYSYFDELPPLIDLEDLTTDNCDFDSAQFDPEWIIADNNDFMMPFEPETIGFMEENYGFNPIWSDSTCEEPMIGCDVFDDTITLTPEKLSRAPTEVLGRSSHGTSYWPTLDNGVHEKLSLSDYNPPGSLASFLYDHPGRKETPLTWPQRLKIEVDVARGLNYLHFDLGVPRGNLKATNVLLDGSDLNAWVSDYCLHRLKSQEGTIEQILDVGVLGNHAPELAASKKPLPSFKADVYAFGMILLELLTGRCAVDVISGEGGGVDLTDWLRLRVAEGCASVCFDSALTQEMGNSAVEKGMKEVLGIALRCIRSVSERPCIKTVYEDLSSI